MRSSRKHGFEHSFDIAEFGVVSQEASSFPYKPRNIGKRRKQKLVLCEGHGQDKQVAGRILVSSIKFDTRIKKRVKKELFEDADCRSEVENRNNTFSASTWYTLTDKAKRREYQGNKLYKRQKGGIYTIDIWKQPFVIQSTGKLRYFDWYNEEDLPWFRRLSMLNSEFIMDNDIDDDCGTDEEVLENGEEYNTEKLVEALTLYLQKKQKFR